MISIIIPAHNEEKNIKFLTDSIITVMEKEKIGYEIVIVDDNSTDKTGKIAQDISIKNRKITTFHRKGGIRGMGVTLKYGTERANGDIIVWVMGDCSDDVNAIPKMVEKIRQGFDMVLGSRYMEGGSSGDLSLTKAAMSKTYTRMTKMIFGIKVHDITNAFRAFRKNVFDSVQLESNDFAISPEFAIKAHKKGFKLGEVPVTYKNRKFGKTKFNFFKMGIKYGKLFSYKIKKT